MDNQSIVVVPTYNEQQNLQELCRSILHYTAGTVDILVVDDNSPDGTGMLADELAVQHPQVHVLHRERKEGLGRAYVAGFQHALQMGYQLIAQMDADFSHDPRDLPRFFEAVGEADLVVGSRYVPGGDVSNWSRQRFWLSFFANRYVKWITRLPVCDATGGYRCWRREVLLAINLSTIRSNGYAFQIEMVYRAFKMGFHVKEIPIVFTERRAGKSKLSKAVIWEAVWLPWKLRFARTTPLPNATYNSNPPV